MQSHTQPRFIPRGNPLPDDLRMRLAKAVERYGALHVGQAAGLADTTICRLVAGLGCYGRSRDSVVAGLAALEKQAP